MNELTEAEEAAILERIHESNRQGRIASRQAQVLGCIVAAVFLLLAASNRSPDYRMLEATGQLEELSR